MKRRTMLKSMGAVSLGMVTPSFAKGERLVEPYKVKEESITTEILVVGGGTTGTIAAIQSGRAGAETILIESGNQIRRNYHHRWSLLSRDISCLGKTNYWRYRLGVGNGLCAVKWR